MPLYAWKGISAAGKPATGNREADGPKSLRQILRKESVFITELHEVVAGQQTKQAVATSASGGKGLRREVDIKRWFERVRLAGCGDLHPSARNLDCTPGFPWPRRSGPWPSSPITASCR